MKLPAHHEENPPPGREEDGVGNAGDRDPEPRGQAAEVGAEEVDGVAARVLMEEGTGGCDIGGDGEPECRGPVALEAAGQVLEGLPFLEAGAAPGGPEIDKERFSLRNDRPRSEWEEGVVIQIDPVRRDWPLGSERADNGDVRRSLEKEDGGPRDESDAKPADGTEDVGFLHDTCGPPSASPGKAASVSRAQAA